MSKLDQALQLTTEWFDDTFGEYDQDGDHYYTSSSKEWGRYRKIVDNMKAFGATQPQPTNRDNTSQVATMGEGQPEPGGL